MNGRQSRTDIPSISTRWPAVVTETQSGRQLRGGTLDPLVYPAAELARWNHGGGFSVHAAVRLEAHDCAGLERLLRYCAQPARYALPKSLPSGQTELTLAPLDLLA